MVYITGEKTMETKNQPESFRAGSIVATVWGNEYKDGEKLYINYSVSVKRSYKDKDGNWADTTSFRVNDIPRVQLVLQQAYSYLVVSHKED